MFTSAKEIHPKQLLKKVNIMTTLLSANEEKSLELGAGSTGSVLKDGDMLIVTTETDSAAAWLDDNGVSGIYFNPEGAVTEYNDYMISSDTTIKLYNS